MLFDHNLSHKLLRRLAGLYSGSTVGRIERLLRNSYEQIEAFILDGTKSYIAID